MIEVQIFRFGVQAFGVQVFRVQRMYSSLPALGLAVFQPRVLERPTYGIPEFRSNGGHACQS